MADPLILKPGVSGLPLSGSDYNGNLATIEQSLLDIGPYIVSGLVPVAGSGLSVTVSAGVAMLGAHQSLPQFTIAPLAPSTVNYLFLQENGLGTSNTTGTPPAASVLLGTATTGASSVNSVDITRTSGRQQFVQPQNEVHGGGVSGLAGNPRSVDLSKWNATAGNGFEVSGVLPAGAAGGMIESGTVAARPAAGNAGAEYLPTDGIYVYRDTGSLWAPWGPLWPLTEPINANFAWINQGSATVDTSRGGVFLFAPANGATNMRIRKMAAPATPYTVTMAMLPSWAPDPATFPLMGIVLRESSTGKLVTLAYSLSTTPRLVPQKWTSPTVFSVAYTPLWDGIGNLQTGPLVWLRVTDDGANLLFSASNDGRQYYQQYSISRTDFLAGGPNEVGFFVNSNQGTYDTAMWVTHFLIT